MYHEKIIADPIVGALQPGYLPWIGFFDQVYHSDIFILYDDLAYSSKSWRNRNRIKGPKGPQWLTVPVLYQRGQKINQVRIDPTKNWQRVHWKTIEHCYRRAHYFAQYQSAFKDIYEGKWEHLCDLNIHIIRYLLGEFGIQRHLVLSSELGLEESFQATNPQDSIPTHRIVHFMRRLGARRFLEGEAGRNYIEENILEEAGITVCYQSYRHKRYTQLFGECAPFLSAIDLLFNCGPHSLDILVNPCPFDKKD